MNRREYETSREELRLAKKAFDSEHFHGIVFCHTEHLKTQAAWRAFVDQWAPTARRLHVYEEWQQERKSA